MKHMVAALTVGACLLFSLAEVVLADNPHNAAIGGTGATGQPGAINSTMCGSIGPTGTMQAEPGNGRGVKSPFNTTGVGVPPNYAGNSVPGGRTNPTAPTGLPGSPAVGSNANTAHAVSEYDVACFQATRHLP